MKKIIAILLTLALVFAMGAVTVFAADTTVTTAGALTTALGSDGEIKLGANIDAGDIVNGNFFTVASGRTVTLDLNGFTLSGTRTGAGNTAIIHNAGTLTIKDSSAAGTGKITITATTNSGWGSYTACVSNMWGTFTLESGTLQNLGGTDMAYAVDNRSNTGSAVSAFIMTGGTLRSENYIGLRLFANSAAAADLCTATISGGTIYGYKRGIWIQQANVSLNEAVLTISGGTIEATTQSAIMADLLGSDGVDIIISGGSLINHSDTYATLMMRDENASSGGGYAGISGGQFFNSGIGGNLFADTVGLHSEIKVSKGQFSTTVPDTYIVGSGTDILVNGTEVTSGVDESYTIIIPAKVDFGTLTRGTGIQEKPFTVSAEGVVIGPTATINVNVTSDFKMKNGSYDLAYSLYDEGTTALVTGGTFASFTASLLTQSEAGKVTVDTTNILFSGDYSGTMTFSITCA